MKRPKLKKASKRLSCHKKYKIQRKVREHKRKVRKEAKKHGNKNKKFRKDPGVPNDAPFKEDILREAEQRKQKLEELKQKQKLARQKEVAKKRKLEAKKENPEITEKPLTCATVKEQKKVVKFEERNSRKSLYGELNKVIDASDVVLEVVDARDPLGYRCPQVEQAILQSEGKKRLVLVINKIDLVPKENAEKWLKYLGNEFPTVAFKSSTQLQDRTMVKKKNFKVNIDMEISHSNTCAGDENLLNLLGSYCRNQKLNSIRVGVVGFPNVGKSSIINSLKKMRACNVGQMKGLTKSMQEVHIDKRIKLLDCPSIIASPSNSAIALALRNLVSVEALENPTTIVELLLKNCNKQQVMLQYNIPDFRTPLEFLMLLARKRSMMKKGGMPDLEKAAKLILCDWTGTKISYHTRPPATELTTKLVNEAERGFNIVELMKGNVKTLKVVKCPNAASSIVFQSTGPTNGLLVERNSEELQDVEEEEVDDEESSETESEVDEDTVEGLKANTSSVAKHLQRKEVEISSKKKQQDSEKIDLPSQKHINIDLSCERSIEDAYDFNTDYI
ncbi:guanine nucleotide-binding protein-like 3 [Pristis pectinata]|uniref:guanine nucleotide-binding protein-like 3 n=1 Tax=Pristis pectinata TaxID=685728 RepID=UPI00223E73D9|nr:guanine nucleotide-binding protein-like 3 [Pristis pectinata]